MRVCLVHEEYPDETNFGGIATYQKQLASKLKSLGNKVFIITRSIGKNKFYQEDGIYIIRIGSTTMKTLTEYICYRKKVCKVLEKLEKEDLIDIIETPDWGAETIFYMSKIDRKIPIVVKLHTPLCVWKMYNENGLDKTVNEKMLQWEKYCIENSEKVISCSNLLKGKLVNQHNMNIKKASVLYNVMDCEQFPFQNKRKNSNIILYCGSLEQRKGVLLLAEAIRKVFIEDENFSAQFVFVGKDTKRNDKEISTVEYIKQLVSSKFEHHLTFLGQYSQVELIDIMNRAKIGIVPSLFDNFPYVAIEEMCTELPVIMSDNVGVKEIIPNNCCVLFESGNSEELKNKIMLLYKNEGICIKIGKDSRKAVERQLNYSVILKNTLSVYKEVTNEYKR